MMERDTFKKAIRLSDVFRGATESQEELLFPIAQRVVFERGAEVFKRGEIADNRILLIVTGTVEILDKMGKPFTRCGPGTILGEIGLISPQHKRTATVVAVGELVCLQLDIEGLKQKDAALYEKIIAHLENITWRRIVESEI